MSILMYMRNKRAIALIALIVIVLVTSAVAAGITVAVTNGLKFTTFYVQKLQALAAAEAGVYAAIADYQDGGYWSKVTTWTKVEGDAYYKVGTDANFLLVDATSANMSEATLQGPFVANINSDTGSPPPIITIKKMTVSWITSGRKLKDIAINSVSKWHDDSGVKSGDPVPESGTLGIDLAQSASVQILLTFNAALEANDTVNIIFEMSDTPASERNVTVFSNGAGIGDTFSITSTGRVGTYKRTVEAVYDVITEKIISWQETTNHI